MRFRLKFFGIISLAIISSYTFASHQTEPVEPEIDLERLEVKNIEVITITGTKSLGSYRRALLKAEKDLYNEYSKITDIEEFKIICANKQTKVDSRKKTQVCTPKFEKTFATRETQFQVSRLGTSLANNFRVNNALADSNRTNIDPTGAAISIPATISSLANIQNVSRGLVTGKLRQKRHEHYLDMLAKVKQNPELAEKLVNYVIAQQEYRLRFKRKKAK